MIEVGQYVGNYRIVSRLGEGGMGAVFEAVHEQISRRAAIKVLLPQLAQNPHMAQRFLNEARAVNLIDHPGLVEIYDIGSLADGTAFIVMELLRGETLTSRLQRRGGKLGLNESLHLLRQVGSALAAAHEKGIVHRDLKPDNVMVVRDPSHASGERIKVLDFGIARMGEAGLQGEAGDGNAGKLTRTGTVMGTVHYMAPEQCTGAGRIDTKADVYALGAMLVHLLAGRPLFVGEGVGAIMAMHIYAAPPSLAELGVDVPPQIELLMARMLAKQPSERPTMLEFIAQTSELAATLPFVRSALGHGDLGVSGNAMLPANQQPTTLSGGASQRPNLTAQLRPGSRWVFAAVALAIAGVGGFGLGSRGLVPPSGDSHPHAAMGAPQMLPLTAASAQEQLKQHAADIIRGAAAPATRTDPISAPAATMRNAAARPQVRAAQTQEVLSTPAVRKTQRMNARTLPAKPADASPRKPHQRESLPDPDF